MLADRPDGPRLSADEQKLLDDLEQRLLHGPTAPPRRVSPAPGRRVQDRVLLVAGLVATAALLVLAAFVGGPGGLAATAAALFGTMVICRLGHVVRGLPRRPRRPRRRH